MATSSSGLSAPVTAVRRWIGSASVIHADVEDHGFRGVVARESAPDLGECGLLRTVLARRKGHLRGGDYKESAGRG